MLRSLVNGEPEDRLSLDDRGLQFGDGLFETLAVVDGRPCLWQRHLERLVLGCRRLRLPAPDERRLWDEARRLIGDTSTAVLKILITRGPSERGYRAPDEVRPTRVLQLFQWAGPGSEPVSNLVVCRQRLGGHPGLGGIKHLNRLEQVLARFEFDEGEGLMLDEEGYAVEATSANLFLLLDGRLHTPLVDRCGVAGVVRSLVLDTARRKGHPVRVGRIPIEDVKRAEGLFLTSSLLGIRSVRAFDGEARKVRIDHHPVLEAAARRVFTFDG